MLSSGGAVVVLGEGIDPCELPEEVGWQQDLHCTTFAALDAVFAIPGIARVQTVGIVDSHFLDPAVRMQTFDILGLSAERRIRPA